MNLFSAEGHGRELAFPADMMLLRAAVKGQLTASDRKAVEAAYRAAAVRAGTPRSRVGDRSDRVPATPGQIVESRAD